MKTYRGRPGVSANGTPDIVENYIFTHKENRMTNKQTKARQSRDSKKATPAAVINAGPTPDKRSVVLKRFARTLGATLLGFAAVWATGPDALDLITDPTHRVILLSVVVPFLTAGEKALRYGDEKGEDPNDTII